MGHSPLGFPPATPAQSAPATVVMMTMHGSIPTNGAHRKLPKTRGCRTANTDDGQGLITRPLPRSAKASN